MKRTERISQRSKGRNEITFESFVGDEFIFSENKATIRTGKVKYIKRSRSGEAGKGPVQQRGHVQDKQGSMIVIYG